MNSINLIELNLDGYTVWDELDKQYEEHKELDDAIEEFKYAEFYKCDNTGETRQHLLEELCDNIQIVVSIANKLDISAEEIANYYNTVHAGKMKNRPRKKIERD